MKDIVKPALTLFLICVIVVGALAVVHGITTPLIDESNAKAKVAAFGKVLPGADDFGQLQTAEQLRSIGLTVPDGILSAIQATKAGVKAGVVIEAASRGYAGAVQLMIGIGADGKLAGMAVIAQNETPGVGSNALEPAFLKQFLDQTAGSTLNLTRSAAAAPGDIQAYSGATITSRAVTRDVQAALTLAAQMLKGGN